MALNGNTLGDAIMAAIDNALDGETADSFDRQAMWRAVGAAIVTHITSNAVVSATGSDPQGGIVTSTGTVA